LHQIQNGRHQYLEGVVGALKDVRLQALHQHAARGVEFERRRQEQFADLDNQDQVVDVVELAFGDARARVASHQDGAAVLQDHHDEQSEFEAGHAAGGAAVGL